MFHGLYGKVAAREAGRENRSRGNRHGPKQGRERERETEREREKGSDRPRQIQIQRRMEFGQVLEPQTLSALCVTTIGPYQTP